ncbi:unnamed protein product [Agarophyton chilense]
MMVVIAITANLFSVLTMLLSTLSELALYRALRRVLAISQCRVLSKGKRCSIRAQKKRLKAVTWGSLGLFLVLETVLSVCSDPIIIPQNTLERCDRLMAIADANQTLDAGSVGDEARIACRKTKPGKELVVLEHGANLSIAGRGEEAGRTFLCEENELYSYARHQHVNHDVQNHKRTCVGEMCVYVIVEGKDVYLSARPTNEERSLQANKTEFTFLKTRVRFDVSKELIGQMGKRLARAVESGERDEERLRTLTLLGLKSGRCVRAGEAGTGRDATNVVTGLLVVACVIWSLTLVFALAVWTKCVRRMEFFDMGCEVQWARKSFRESPERERECERGGERGGGRKGVHEGCELMLHVAVVSGRRCVQVRQRSEPDGSENLGGPANVDTWDDVC